MSKKMLFLLASILILAAIVVVGSSVLVKKAKEQPREEEIPITEVERLLSLTKSSTADRFLTECRAVLEEKGYLPKEETIKRMIAFVNDAEPELAMDYRSICVVSVSGDVLLAFMQTGGELYTYQMADDEVDMSAIGPGTEVCALSTVDMVLDVEKTEPADIMLEAAWIKGNTEGELTVKYGGREFALANFDEDYHGYEDIADIEIKDGGVTSVRVYTDKINARLLSIRNQYIELEDVGIYPYAEQIQVYKLFGEYEPYTLSDLKIGYDFTDFVLNDKKEIVAALVSGEGYLDRIRVVIKTTNFESAYHEKVVLSCDTDMEWKCGDTSGMIQGGKEICLDAESDMFEHARITFTPVAISAKTELCSVERNQGIPSYRGTLEVERTQEGLLVINELPLDEYLYSVVPSEMPSSYPMEALKAQAVSARTYAYAHMLDSRMQSYGAHVDDSAAFQVYNNIHENDMTTRAVRETEGVVVCRNGKPVTTYFYSTSCGYGTDLTAWMVENDAYLQAGKIGSGDTLNLTDNDMFAEYIKRTDDSCYESSETYFRWKYETEVDEQLFLENLQKRYTSNPDQVLTKTPKGYVAKEIREFGELKNIEIVKRAEGGAITELILVGGEATVKIMSEKNVRYILANESTGLKLGAKYDKDGTANGMLPSAFLTIETEHEPSDNEEEEKKITSYTVWGGGFGHGIGMSQNGAKQMAKNGMTYESILSSFYIETDLEKMKKEEK